MVAHTPMTKNKRVQQQKQQKKEQKKQLQQQLQQKRSVRKRKQSLKGKEHLQYLEYERENSNDGGSGEGLEGCGNLGSGGGSDEQVSAPAVLAEITPPASGETHITTPPIPSAVTPTSSSTATTTTTTELHNILNITLDTPIMDRERRESRIRCPGSFQLDLAEAARVITTEEHNNILHHIYNMYQSEGLYGKDVFDFLFNNNTNIIRNNSNINNNNNKDDNDNNDNDNNNNNNINNSSNSEREKRWFDEEELEWLFNERNRDLNEELRKSASEVETLGVLLLQKQEEMSELLLKHTFTNNRLRSVNAQLTSDLSEQKKQLRVANDKIIVLKGEKRFSEDELEELLNERMGKEREKYIGDIRDMKVEADKNCKKLRDVETELGEKEKEIEGLLELNEMECGRVRKFEKVLDDANRECGRLRTENVKLKNQRKAEMTQEQEQPNEFQTNTSETLVTLTDAITLINDRLNQHEQLMKEQRQSHPQQQQTQTQGGLSLGQLSPQKHQQSTQPDLQQSPPQTTLQQPTQQVLQQPPPTTLQQPIQPVLQQPQQTGTQKLPTIYQKSPVVQRPLQFFNNDLAVSPPPPPNANKMVPGNRNYSDVVKQGPQICVFSTSITKHIKKKELNDLYVGEGTISFRRFHGAIARDVKKYIGVHLEEETPESVIIQTGGNDLPTPRSNPVPVSEIAGEIIKSGLLCQRGGVKNIFIGGVLLRRPYYTQSRCRELNELLREECKRHGFIYIDNTNIDMSHVHDDGVHLTFEGSNILRDNYSFYLNSIAWSEMFGSQN